ncbi:MAG: multidrug effflux MFS transporter [Pseudomonadota bacterium]
MDAFTEKVAPPHLRQRHPAPLPLLILIAAIQPIAMNMYVPAMAAMQGDLQTSASALQATLWAFLLATALGQLVAGPLSDMFGRRHVLLGGLSLFMVGTVICTLAQSVETLIAGRIIQGIGGCAGLVLSRAIIRDVHGAANSASMIGYVTMGMAVGPLITPALGGVIYEAWSWRVIFAVIGAFGLFALAVSVLRLEETHPAAGKRTGIFSAWRRELKELLAIADFWRFALTLGALCVAFFSFIAGGAFIAIDIYELSASQYGVLFIFVVAGYVAGNFVTGRFGPRFGVVPMIIVGNAISLLGVAIALVLGLLSVFHPLALFAPMFVVGVGNGFALPNTVAGCVSVKPELAGSASGLAGAFQVGSGALSSIVVGLLIDAQAFSNMLWAILIPMCAGATAAFMLSLTLRSESLK